MGFLLSFNLQCLADIIQNHDRLCLHHGAVVFRGRQIQGKCAERKGLTICADGGNRCLAGLLSFFQHEGNKQTVIRVEKAVDPPAQTFCFRRRQCDACNPVYIGRIGRDTWPFAACASATAFSAETGHIVGVFKDQGEQRLAAAMAACMARAVPPDWPVDAVTFVPATLAAMRFRGFDHAELLARETARALGVPYRQLLARPHTRDQRKLTRGQRIANLAGSFRAASDAGCGLRLLLIDDVFTTGATLCAATDALLASGAVEVRCLTFARV